MVTFDCVVCSTKLTVPDGEGGRSTRCTECGEVLVVPRPAPRRPAKEVAASEPEPDGPTCPSCASDQLWLKTVSAPGSRPGEPRFLEILACARCGHTLDTPPADGPTEPAPRRRATGAPKEQSRPRPPANVFAVFDALSLGGLALVALAVYLVAPAPALTRDSVERQLREELPPDYEKLSIDEFARDTGRLQFRVRFYDNSLVPTEYEVVRYRSDGGWRVQVVGRRRPLDHPVEQWLMVEAVFDRRGRITKKKGATLAPPGEGPLFEARARAIALAVHEVF